MAAGDARRLKHEQCHIVNAMLSGASGECSREARDPDRPLRHTTRR
jgi:hypothetical protein